MDALTIAAAIYLIAVLAAVAFVAVRNPRRFRRHLMSGHLNFWRGLGRGLGWVAAAAVGIQLWRWWG